MPIPIYRRPGSPRQIVGFDFPAESEELSMPDAILSLEYSEPKVGDLCRDDGGTVWAVSEVGELDAGVWPLTLEEV